MFALLKRGLDMFSSSPSRLLRFSLNNALRPYLKDELQQENFDVQLWQGVVNIQNLDLNEVVLNKKLNSAPFHIVKAKIGKLAMDVPWRKVSVESVKVLVQDITVTIALGPAPPCDHAVEEYMEKCIEKALASSQHIAEAEITEETIQDSSLEDLGIQSVEELFENIFKNMNISLQRISIFVEHGGQRLLFSINDMTLTNDVEDQASKENNVIRKLATLQDLSVSIMQPQELQGPILRMSNKNYIHIGYAQHGNVTSLDLFMDILNGSLQTVITAPQLQLLKKFVDGFMNPPEPASTTEEPNMTESFLSASSTLGNSIYESTLYESAIYEEQLESLERSILNIAPYVGASVAPVQQFDFTTKIRLKQASLTLADTASRFTFELFDFTVLLRQVEDKNTVDVVLENLRLSELYSEQPNLEKPTRIDLIKFVPTGKHKPILRCNVEMFTKKVQRITDVKLALPIIELSWSPKSVERLVKILSPAQPNIQSTAARKVTTLPQPDSSMLNLKLPVVHILVNFSQELQSEKRPISCLDLEIRELRLRKMPSDEDTTTRLSAEFESLYSFLTIDREKKPFVSIWTTDSDDKPKVEITFQEPSIFARPIPSLMIDLEKSFQRPVFFSFLSKDCMEVLPQNQSGRIDLERTKQLSGMVLDIVFPCLQVEMNKDDFAFWGAVFSQLGGDSKSSSSTILGIGKATVVLQDGLEPIELDRSNAPRVPEFRLEVDELRMFQSTLYSKEKSGTFVYINNKDAKLLDNDMAALVRRTPQQLRLDQIFCAPFAVNLPVLQLVVNGSTYCFESATAGFKPASWVKFIRIFTGETKDAPNQEQSPQVAHSSSLSSLSSSSGFSPSSFSPLPSPSPGRKGLASSQNASSSETSIELTIRTPSIYFQPTTGSASPNSSFVVPPRAILSFGTAKMKWSTSSHFAIEFENIGLWLKEDFHYLKNSETFLDFSHPELSSHFKSKCLIEVLRIQTLDLTIQTKDSLTEMIINCMKPLSDPSSNPLVLTARPDSFETLIKVCTLLSTDLAAELAAGVKEAPKEEKHEQKVSINAMPLFMEDYQHPSEKRPSKEKSHPIDIQVSSRPRARSSSSKHQRSSSKDLSHSVILFDEESPLSTSAPPRERKKRSPGAPEAIEESWEWVGRGSKDSSKHKENEEDRIFLPNLPKSTSFRICNLVVCIQFVGGNDWENDAFYERMNAAQYRKNKALEGRGDSVEVQMDVPSITFDTYTSLHSLWRLSVDIRRMLIDDHINTSHHAKLLTFTRGKQGSQQTSAIKLILEQLASGAYKFKLLVSPMRLYLDQDTLTFLGDFFTYNSSITDEPPAPAPVEQVEQIGNLFEYFEMGAIDTVIDYKPRNTIGQVYSDIRLGNNIWAIKIVELNKAPITLSGAKLHRIKDTSELTQALLSTWVKDFKQAQLYNYLYGTRIGQAVQISLNIGSGVVDLIKTPVAEYNKGGNVLKGIGIGATSLAQKLTIELLNIGASSAITIKKGLTGIDKAISGTSPTSDKEHHISAYANQPQNITQGASQAASSIKSGFESSLNALYYGGIRSLPSALLKPAIGLFEASSNVALGIRNTLDKSAYESSQEKYKTGGNPEKDNKEKRNSK